MENTILPDLEGKRDARESSVLGEVGWLCDDLGVAGLVG